MLSDLAVSQYFFWHAIGNWGDRCEYLKWQVQLAFLRGIYAESCH